jgi:hypothetical protein
MRKSPLIFLLILIVLPMISAQWWDNDWEKRSEITITETSGTTLTNFSLLLTIPYDSDMNSDFSDLRFTLDNHNTELNYWIESKTDSVEAKVWILFPTLPANLNTSIFMYYDNNLASTNSNFNSAFLYADDFESDTLGNYNIVGNICTNAVVSGGNLVVNVLGSQVGPCTIAPLHQFQYIQSDYLVETSLSIKNDCGYAGAVGYLPFSLDYTFGGYTSWIQADINSFGIHTWPFSWIVENNFSVFANIFYETEIEFIGTNIKNARLDNANDIFLNHNAYQSGYYGVAGLYEGCNTDSQTTIEWFRVRPSTTQQPTFNISNEEQLQDDDKDGVSNRNDICPNSKLNEPVDDNGCDIFQFCMESGFSCGLGCLQADWKNNESNILYPNDCTIIIPLRNGQEQQPICVPTEYGRGCAG